MQTTLGRWRQSASLKVAAIGFLVLVLLIPLAMIEGVIRDRTANSDAATDDIMRTWGGAQFIAGPIVVLPYESERITSGRDRIAEKTTAYVLPEQLTIDAELRPDLRYRGLHKVPVYSADIRVRGTISPLIDSNLAIPTDAVHWNEATIAVVVSDARAIVETPTLRIAGRDLRFRPGGQSIGGQVAPIVVPIGAVLTAAARGTELRFDFTLRVNGTDQLNFAPLGDTTAVKAHSTWPSPSFVGNYLPATREVRDDGFDAAWNVSSIGRALPSQWTAFEPIATTLEQSAFGVKLFQPVSLYQLTSRAAKYGVLFIGLTFVTWFLFEAVGGLRLHPLQYLLVGLANALFFLLLLSLAEHIGFGASYLVSAAASSALIVGYSYTILGSRVRAGVMAAILALLYGLLYMTLNAETYALLAGSVGLWLALALIMYLTRRIDWYTLNAPDER